MPEKQVKFFGKSGWLWFLIIVLISGISFLGIKHEDKNTGSKKVAEQSVIRYLEVDLRPDDWTDWIRLEPGDAWQLDAPGWIEYEFWDGTKKYVPDKGNVYFGKIQNSTFRLRGTRGKAKITIEPKTP